MIGNIAQFWRLTRELDVGAIREDFEHSASIRVLGSDQALADWLARLIDPDALGTAVTTGLLGDWSVSVLDRRPRPDVYVVGIGQTLEAAARRAIAELGIGEAPLLLVQVDDGADLLVVGVPEERIIHLSRSMAEAEARERLVDALVRLAPEAMLPLGRDYPTVRETVAQHLIRDASRVNAQFAAVSSLPANIPLVGGLVGDMADMLVLTKNQVILIFKLAGLYGRNLALGADLLLEVMPVVGGAFLWRSTARALVGLLPTFLSLLPKTVVAYTGTFVVGEMARYYYRYGRKPPPEMVRGLQAEGARLAQTALKRLNRGR